MFIYKTLLKGVNQERIKTTCIENIFSQLNKENKNFKSSLIEKNAKNRDLKNPIDWLELAFLVNNCSLVKEVITIPFYELFLLLKDLSKNDLK